MKIIFNIVRRGQVPFKKQPNNVYLIIDHWNDYSFVTSFHVVACDENGNTHDLSIVKIGFKNQTTAVATYEKLDTTFDQLSEDFFSVATDVEYYKKLYSDFSENWRNIYLKGLKDIVFDNEIIGEVENEEVFYVSLLRGVPLNSIKNQFTRVLQGDSIPTDFNFNFELPETERNAGFNLEFQVHASSTPSTNVHALIGRNGVGKTTLLNEMVKAISCHSVTNAKFYEKNRYSQQKEINDDYFSNLISVSFSAFDPFDLPASDERPSAGIPYSYIGLTDYSDSDGAALLKSRDSLYKEFVEALMFCMSEEIRKKRWSEAISVLESDINFQQMKLQKLILLQDDELKNTAHKLIKKMSSGHAISILTITQLVAKVQEQTLVLIDEPESHLHPPLLSAFIRSLSQLLHRQNGVAIIATHSPVILQEIPKSCIWKLNRFRKESSKSRPEIETFGENVGTLTKEVFGLEVENSGFHTLLKKLVDTGKNYEEILEELNNSLGMEGRGILRALISIRDSRNVKYD